jgi:hypothetical protein
MLNLAVVFLHATIIKLEYFSIDGQESFKKERREPIDKIPGLMHTQNT